MIVFESVCIKEGVHAVPSRANDKQHRRVINQPLRNFANDNSYQEVEARLNREDKKKLRMSAIQKPREGIINNVSF